MEDTCYDITDFDVVRCAPCTVSTADLVCIYPLWVQHNGAIYHMNKFIVFPVLV